MNNSVTKFYSQSGEDEILFKIFQDKQQGLCVEVGGFNGVDASNSYFFEKLGWRCIVVEPIPELCEEIRSKRKCRLFNCAAGDYNGETKFYVHEQDPIVSSLNFTNVQLDYQRYNRQTLREIPVEMKTLDRILEEENIKEKEIDFISIDVEGHEINVLRGFSLQKYSPRILIIEDNSNMTDDRVRKFMSQFGYVLFKRTGVNDWYAKETDSIVDKDEVSKLKMKRMKALFSLSSLKSKIRPFIPSKLVTFIKKIRDSK